MIMIAERDGAMIFLTTDPKLTLWLWLNWGMVGELLLTTGNIFETIQTEPMIMIAEKDGAMIFLTTDPKLILWIWLNRGMGGELLLTTGNIFKKSQPDPMTIIDVKDGATFPRKRSFKVTGRHTSPQHFSIWLRNAQVNLVLFTVKCKSARRRSRWPGLCTGLGNQILRTYISIYISNIWNECPTTFHATYKL